MKISLNWLKQYIELPETVGEISEMLTGTGLEVEGIEAYEEFEGGLSGLVIGEVMSCELHPNADKLKITHVDIGTAELSPIVCGAPNVASGQKVIVATVGSTLYPTSGEPFKIKKAKIRGEISEGMICAEDEIGLGISHDGIIILDTKLPNGTPVAELYKPFADSVFEIGLTPNRADAISHIGVARDLKALLSRELRFPDTTVSIPDTPASLEVLVEDKEACPRYSGIEISDLTVKESPTWLRNALQAIGQSPINNVVDITNYVLHATGQPLHAFDAAKITGNQIKVRTMPEGTAFTTLDEVERKLAETDLIICNSEEGMCIAGVFGGTKSGVTESTKAIFLESAYFSPTYIRRTSQKHQLKTDASFRFERGTDPNNTIEPLKLAAKMIVEICGGKISSSVVDIYDKRVEALLIDVEYKNIDRLIGEKLSEDRIKTILTALDFDLISESREGLQVKTPTYRVDVTREADVIEEILRIYGYDNIPLSTQLGSDYLADFSINDEQQLSNKISDLLVANGYFEIFTNSLTNPAYTAESTEWPKNQNIEVLNKLSEELGIMRQTLLYSGLESVRYNISHRQTNLKFFELGKTYKKNAKGYKEEKMLVLFQTGDSQPEHWYRPEMEATFYDLDQTINNILTATGIPNIEMEPIEQEPFAYALELRANTVPLARYGKLSSSVCARLEIKQSVFYAEIYWAKLSKYALQALTYTEVPKYPEVRRDLSLVIDKKISFKDIKEVALQTEKKLIKKLNVFSVYQGEKIDPDKKAYAISFILQDSEKTLKDKVIDKVMNQLISVFENELNALIRK